MSFIEKQIVPKIIADIPKLLFIYSSKKLQLTSVCFNINWSKLQIL